MSKLVGTIDAYLDGQIAGWAWNPYRPDERVGIEAFVDQRLVARFNADTHRDDLVAAGIGDGRYAFFLKLHDIAPASARTLDLRFAETGASLSGTPVDLAETYHRHNTTLVELLEGGPFWLDSFDFDGHNYILSGFYHPKHGNVADLSIHLDDTDPVDLYWSPVDDRAKRDFWFLNPRAGGFRAIFRTGGMRSSTSSDLRVELLDPIEPLDPLRAYLLPASASAYRNLPDSSRQKRVMGWANDSRFTFLGRTHHETICTLSGQYGMRRDVAQRVLDLGVGCGRIARHFLAHDPQIQAHGVDIDIDNVAWCQANLAGGIFQACPSMPPLAYSAASFDIVHANSVFTHLDECMQDVWLDEIARLLSPNGVAIVTIHAETAVAYARMPVDWIERWRETGIDAVGRNNDLDGLINDQNYYRNTYHATAYVRQRWSSRFDIVGRHPHLFGYQDAFVLKKRS